MNKGLIIGASSGIGETIATYALNIIPDYEWLMPGTDILDVRSQSEIYACLKQEGPFKYIVYSAGVNRLAWVHQLAFSSVAEDTWDVNCNGFIKVMSAHENLYKDAEGSAIVISSDAARRPMRGSLAYCASKAALDMAVRVMARELAPRWRVNAISPGITDGTLMTDYLDEHIPGFRGWTPEQARQYEVSQIPMGRRAAREEIAEVAVSVLLSPEYLTGAIIEVNGGRS
jgi:NAD(P)-dependent dehydrogenase (short-subunit alcohol dehydrogenase family)